MAAALTGRQQSGEATRDAGAVFAPREDPCYAVSMIPADGSAGRRAFTRPITVLLLAQLFTGTLLAPAFTFFPLYLQDLGISAAVISLVVALQRVSGLATSLAGGPLLRRLGAKRAIVLGEACLFVATFVFITRGGTVASLIWAVSGIGLALNSLAGQSYLMEHANPAHLGILAAFLAWGWTLGATIGNPAAGILMGGADYRLLSMVTALPALATLAFTTFALPRGKSLLRPVAGAPRSPSSGLSGSLAVATLPSVRPLAAMRFLATFCYGLTILFVPLLLKAAGASHQLIAIYATVNNTFASVTQLAVGRIADRVSWRVPTVVACATLASSALAVGVFPAHVWVVFVAATIAVAAAWSLSTLLPTHISRATRPEDLAGTLGLMQLTWYAAMIAGGLVGGILYQAWRGLPLILGAAAAAATLPAARAFFRRVREA